MTILTSHQYWDKVEACMSHDNTDSFLAILQNFKAKFRWVNFPTSPFDKLDFQSLPRWALFVLTLNQVAVDSRWTFFLWTCSLIIPLFLSYLVFNLIWINKNQLLLTYFPQSCKLSLEPERVFQGKSYFIIVGNILVNKQVLIKQG